nr:hypothetical protein [Amoebophilaceae bacterium]
MMYSYLLNRLVATVIVYGLLLQGCRSGFRINSEDFSLEKSRQIDNDGQITHPDVQSSVLSGVPHSKLPTVASAILPSMTASTDQVASLMHHLAVGPDTVSSWGPSSSTESEEIDTKPAAQVAGCSSVGYSASLCASLFSVPASVFGVQEWRRYLGEVGEAPCLPSAIDEILHSACPFWPGKLVKDTHLLILIPSTVDGKAFTLDLLGELIQNPRGDGHRTQYFLYDDE